MSIFILSHDSSYSWRLSWQALYQTTHVFDDIFDNLVNATRGRFHQHFTSSYYVRRSQKRKNDRNVISLFFALSGFAHVKAAPKHVGEIEPRRSSRGRDGQERPVKIGAGSRRFLKTLGQCFLTFCCLSAFLMDYFILWRCIHPFDKK